MRRATPYNNFGLWIVLVYLHPLRCSSLLKCVLQPKFAEKSLKSPYGKFKVVQGH